MMHPKTFLCIHRSNYLKEDVDQDDLVENTEAKNKTPQG